MSRVTLCKKYRHTVEFGSEWVVRESLRQTNKEKTDVFVRDSLFALSS